VLSLLELGPLHPYGIQRLLKLWGKDQVVNVGQRASLYRTINRLRDGGLIAVLQNEREHQFPERTVYELTEVGRDAAQHWLTDVLATPRNEFPEFPAALSFAMLLAPEQLVALLEQRIAGLHKNLDRLDRDLRATRDTLPRVTMLDSEFQRAISVAELAWLRGIAEDLRTGQLNWDAELNDMARSFVTDVHVDSPERGDDPGSVLPVA
jgi:DNA-binding PadR family transcriptional regulator